MATYYNEIDPFCCDWLRQLIKRGLIPGGEIDNRSIEDVRPEDVRGFTQCHFFAGIGGWAYALRQSGWPDDRPVWTGSCPCQPFSTAGKRAGTSDQRHLWPSFFWLISQCRPDTIIGEQVASKDALAWWDIVRTDLEAESYTCGVCDTCAAGYGAPHIRQRLYWLAQSQSYGRRGRYHGDAFRLRGEVQIAGRGSPCELGNNNNNTGLQGWRIIGRNDAESQDGCAGAAGLSNGLAHASEFRPEWHTERTEIQGQRAERTGKYAQPRDARELSQGLERCGRDCRVGDTESYGMENSPKGKSLTRKTNGQGIYGLDRSSQASDRPCPTNGFWSNPDWLWCRDKKWRPIESGIIPLVDGLSKGVVRGRDCRAIRQRLQGYGNAIVVPQAVEFIKTIMDVVLYGEYH